MGDVAADALEAIDHGPRIQRMIGSSQNACIVRAIQTLRNRSIGRESERRADIAESLRALMHGKNGGERPFAEAELCESETIKRGVDVNTGRTQRLAALRENVLGAHGMAVSGIRDGKPELDERIDRLRNSETMCTETMDERDVLAAALNVKLGQRGQGIAMVGEKGELGGGQGGHGVRISFKRMVRMELDSRGLLLYFVRRARASVPGNIPELAA